ncbi:MAG: diguanylate cyclase [Clostridia bacterium]|nr:diguanylate cyclase [Clostridia bacterium]MBR4261151.1 diguanylate cyclase [Clostridia bacterium]
MIQYIYIVDENIDLYSKLEDMFVNEDSFCLKHVREEELEIVLKSIPALIIINEDSIKGNIIDLCNRIRENDDNKITPIIVISSNTDHNHRVEVLQASVEHFIKKPIDDEYLYYTIINIINLLDINRTVSPLTGLPGNVQIHAEMKRRMLNKEPFTMLYLDLDNFKAYNDTYGFIKGDEIIKFTARTIVKNVHEIDSENGFIGHIGGDDFIAIISNDKYEELCQNIILDFDYNVLDYYDKAHIERGYIEVENRKGILEQYPLTSISIGVVYVDETFHNILEIGEVGAQVKRLSKSIPGSTYVVNRRKNNTMKSE